jgi:prepilin-type N-terminal cleavage/methylation domain-containing protein
MKKRESHKGFSLIELIVYVAIFAVSSVFLVAILTSVTRVQIRQKSANEVNHQISFVGTTIERLVQESSLIDIDAGVATSTLVIRMSSSTLDPTRIYASSSLIYLEEATSTPIALTDSRVKVDSFSVVKYENPGGKAIVHVNLALSYNADNTQTKFSRAVQLAVARISAANFDASLLPNSNNSFDFGSASFTWKDGYFSGNLGIGTTPSSNAKIIASGDITVSTSSKGLVLTSADASCYRLTVTNGGSLTTTSITCP